MQLVLISTQHVLRVRGRVTVCATGVCGTLLLERANWFVRMAYAVKADTTALKPAPMATNAASTPRKRTFCDTHHALPSSQEPAYGPTLVHDRLMLS